MEALVGMKAIKTMYRKNITIHIRAISEYTIAWLNLIGIEENNVISQNIFANKLIVPEMGGCGNPSSYQIKWLQETLSLNTSSERNIIVLIKRTKRRKMKEFDEIQAFVNDFAVQNELQMIIHDDAHLPSLALQLNLFSKAKIILGPHGAGFVNLIAAQPGSCVVEFLSLDPNLCYMRLSYILGFKYISIPLYSNQSISIINLKDAINRC